MPIIPNEDRKSYVIIDKIVVEHPNMSVWARMILTYLLGKPRNWNLNVKHLAKEFLTSRAKIYIAINELTREGHIIYIRNRNTKGKFESGTYYVFEKSQLGNENINETILAIDAKYNFQYDSKNKAKHNNLDVDCPSEILSDVDTKLQEEVLLNDIDTCDTGYSPFLNPRSDLPHVDNTLTTLNNTLPESKIYKVVSTTTKPSPNQSVIINNDYPATNDPHLKLVNTDKEVKAFPKEDNPQGHEIIKGVDKNLLEEVLPTAIKTRDKKHPHSDYPRLDLPHVENMTVINNKRIINNNTTTSKKGDKLPTRVYPPSSNPSVVVCDDNEKDKLLGDKLTFHQETLVKKLAESFVEDYPSYTKQEFASYLSALLLNKNAFNLAGNDFVKKFNTIKKMLRDKKLNVPILQKNVEVKEEPQKEIQALEIKRREYLGEIMHWKKMKEIAKALKKEDEVSLHEKFITSTLQQLSLVNQAINAFSCHLN